MKTSVSLFGILLLVIGQSYASREIEFNAAGDAADAIESSGDVPRQIDCTLEQAVGFCKALIPRFYYNSETKNCEEFNYGGCGGNTNNFITKEECEEKCSPNNEKLVNIEPRKIAEEEPTEQKSLHKNNATASSAVQQLSIGAFLVTLAIALHL